MAVSTDLLTRFKIVFNNIPNNVKEAAATLRTWDPIFTGAINDKIKEENER